MRKSLLLGVCASALLAGSALAADLPARARPAPVAPIPVFSWTGFYIGANIGGAWSNSTLTDNVTGASFSTNNSGFIGGGQFGYNWQFNNNWVLGIEGDIDGTTISKTSNAVPTGLGTLRSRDDTAIWGLFTMRFSTSGQPAISLPLRVCLTRRHQITLGLEVTSGADGVQRAVE